jgi:hypothetical protein
VPTLMAALSPPCRRSRSARTCASAHSERHRKPALSAFAQSIAGSSLAQSTAYAAFAGGRSGSMASRAHCRWAMPIHETGQSIVGFERQQAKFRA